MQKFESREVIKERMLRNAAKQWGQHHSKMVNTDAFDPLIDLLMGAFSFELEQMGNNIQASRSRVFEHLLKVLVPDAMLTAQPAHAIMQAQPMEAIHTTNPEEQFYCRPTGWDKDLFFSPAGQFSLINGKVECIAHKDKIFHLGQSNEKELLASANFGQQLEEQILYLGIELSPAIKQLHQLSLFWGCKKEIPTSTPSAWFINGKMISCKKGLAPQKNNNKLGFSSTTNINQQIEENLFSFYQKKFYTLSSKDNLAIAPKGIYPTFFKTVFSEAGLQRLKKELLWIEIKLSHHNSFELDNSDIALNCFPVLNRRLTKKIEKIEEGKKMLGLEIKDNYFLSIKEVTDENTIPLKEIQFQNRNKDGRFYAIRKEGVERFGKGDALQQVNQLLETIKDEMVAFKAFDGANLSEDLKEMEQISRRIKDATVGQTIQSKPYVYLQIPEEKAVIFLNYWTTDGAYANKIPYGTSFKAYSNEPVISQSLQLITTSTGGKAPGTQTNFRRALSKGRIVTREDIKSYCYDHFGKNNLQLIEIKQGVMPIEGLISGLTRTLEVSLFPTKNTQLNARDWSNLISQAESELTKNSVGTLPINILIQHN